MKNLNRFLIFGDIVAIAVITVIGFATHSQIGISYLLRMSTTFFPVLISWFLIAPWLGLFNQEVTTQFRQLWRPALGMVFAAPMATMLRAAILNAPALYLFTFYLGLTSALLMVLWRAIYIWLTQRAK